MVGYGQYLARLNKLPDFVDWLFSPGMRFGDRNAWWSPDWRRPTPHEGVDFVLYRDRNGDERYLAPSFLVPVVQPGEVVAVFDDFLARTVCVRHDRQDSAGRILCSLYGHVNMLAGMSEGDNCEAGTVLAEVAPGRAGAGRVSPHLHLSLAWLPARVIVQGPSWSGLSEGNGVTLVDPVHYLAGDNRRLADDLNCSV